MALIGFPDLPLADLLEPGISVIAQDHAAIGREAANLLFDRLAGERGPARHRVLATRYLARLRRTPRSRRRLTVTPTCGQDQRPEDRACSGSHAVEQPLWQSSRARETLEMQHVCFPYPFLACTSISNEGAGLSVPSPSGTMLPFGSEGEP